MMTQTTTPKHTTLIKIQAITNNYTLGLIPNPKVLNTTIMNLQTKNAQVVVANKEVTIPITVVLTQEEDTVVLIREEDTVVVGIIK